MKKAKHYVGRSLALMNRPFGKRRFERAIHDALTPVCIELGALTTSHPGWIATDVSWRCKNYLDVTKPWPVDDESVDFIFSDNMIEHLTLAGARAAFRESYRVLRVGGVMRIVTPDIGALVHLYDKDPACSVDLRGELLQEGYLVQHQVDILRFAFQDDGHHLGYLWDKASITAELQAAGFPNVDFHAPAQSPHELLRNLDMRVTVPLGKIMLAAEAIK